ncbi:MAG: sulfotransferase [Prolixibacteraceae bacterium]|nr:sulfotransferase [Prolixibacteraceae bacterium]
MSKSVIHIGANKTGSTTLQRYLFSKIDKLIYLGEDCNDYNIYKDILNSLILDDDIHYRYLEAKELFNYLNTSAKASEKTFIFSSEDVMSSHVPSLCAKRLHEFLPDADILLIIRNQLTAIPSWYANHGAYLKKVPRRYWRRYVCFDEWMDYCIEFMNYSPLDSFFYHRILGLYEPLFGLHKIHILFYEDFVENKTKFIKNICEILEIREYEKKALSFIEGKRERKRHSMRQLKYNKLCSFLGGKDIVDLLPTPSMKKVLRNFLDSGMPADGFVSEKWKKTIEDLYEQDNHKLVEKYKLDLGKYGYPLPKGK